MKKLSAPKPPETNSAGSKPGMILVTSVTSETKGVKIPKRIFQLITSQNNNYVLKTKNTVSRSGQPFTPGNIGNLSLNPKQPVTLGFVGSLSLNTEQPISLGNIGSLSLNPEQPITPGNVGSSMSIPGQPIIPSGVARLSLTPELPVHLGNVGSLTQTPEQPITLGKVGSLSSTSGQTSSLLTEPAPVFKLGPGQNIQMLPLKSAVGPLIISEGEDDVHGNTQVCSDISTQKLHHPFKCETILYSNKTNNLSSGCEASLPVKARNPSMLFSKLLADISEQGAEKHQKRTSFSVPSGSSTGLSNSLERSYPELLKTLTEAPVSDLLCMSPKPSCHAEKEDLVPVCNNNREKGRDMNTAPDICDCCPSVDHNYAKCHSLEKAHPVSPHESPKERPNVVYIDVDSNSSENSLPSKVDQNEEFSTSFQTSDKGEQFMVVNPIIDNLRDFNPEKTDCQEHAPVPGGFGQRMTTNKCLLNSEMMEISHKQPELTCIGTPREMAENSDHSSEWRIESVYSLALEDTEKTSNENACQFQYSRKPENETVSSKNETMSENENVSFSITDSKWRQFCQPCFVVLERIPVCEGVNLSEEEVSSHCSLHCRLRTLSMLCGLKLLDCCHSAAEKKTVESSDKGNDSNHVTSSQLPRIVADMHTEKRLKRKNACRIKSLSSEHIPVNPNQGSLEVKEETVMSPTGVRDLDAMKFKRDLRVLKSQIEFKRKEMCKKTVNKRYKIPRRETRNKFKKLAPTIKGIPVNPESFLENVYFSVRENKFSIREKKNREICQCHSFPQLSSAKSAKPGNLNSKAASAALQNKQPSSPVVYCHTNPLLYENLHVTDGYQSTSYCNLPKSSTKNTKMSLHSTLTSPRFVKQSMLSLCNQAVSQTQMSTAQNTPTLTSHQPVKQSMLSLCSQAVSQTQLSTAQNTPTLTSHQPVKQSMLSLCNQAVSQTQMSTAQNTPTLTSHQSVKQSMLSLCNQAVSQTQMSMAQNTPTLTSHQPVVSQCTAPKSLSILHSLLTLNREGGRVTVLPTPNANPVTPTKLKAALESLNSYILKAPLTFDSNKVNYFIIKIDDQQVLIKTSPPPIAQPGMQKEMTSKAGNSVPASHNQSSSQKVQQSKCISIEHGLGKTSKISVLSSAASATPAVSLNSLLSTQKGRTDISFSSPSPHDISQSLGSFQQSKTNTLPQTTSGTIPSGFMKRNVSTLKIGGNLSTVSSDVTITSCTTSNTVSAPKRKMSDLSVEEQKRVKRKRLEAKYPLPPGVTIKSEPVSEGDDIDSNWSVASEIDTGFVQQDNQTNISELPFFSEDEGDRAMSILESFDSQELQVISNQCEDHPPVLENVADSSSHIDEDVSKVNADEAPPLLQPMGLSSSSSFVDVTTMEEYESPTDELSHQNAFKNIPSPRLASPQSESGYSSLHHSSSCETLGPSSSATSLSSNGDKRQNPSQSGHTSKLQQLRELLKKKELQVERMRRVCSALPQIDLDSV